MQDKQSTNKIFMVEPEVFFMNPQTASSNHYQVDDDSISTDEILKQAKEEFNTFKNAQDLREVAKQIPSDRILIETDSPYLTPVPYRGKPNSPAYTYYVAEKLAEIRNSSVAEIARVTTQNFNQLFFS